ncbi:hypothetical protein DKY63_08020 [Pseudomonas putida]|uniref:Uncharacterized protein n=1 Tax=Pseudomonas putida TaxID=303 RepID=A0A2Z4RG75_PSEPU|nr:hypothetical protein DKY63_08020 [Pseudomonas putida]
MFRTQRDLVWSEAHACRTHGAANVRVRRAQQVAGEDVAVMIDHGCKRSFLLLMSWFAIFYHWGLAGL